jgi:lipoprotein-anchoring transpeptidase ErfK/SrfK
MAPRIIAFARSAVVLVAILCSLTWPIAAQTPSELAPPAKRVEIDKTTQRLRAYEGDRLVLESCVSTGRWDRSTPNGEFRAGEKQRMHYSRLFDNAPMPYSVEVTGNVFIHGFTVVPPWPASNGCIRLPLNGDNPAKRFFEWIEPGTPITISGMWKGKTRGG